MKYQSLSISEKKDIKKKKKGERAQTLVFSIRKIFLNSFYRQILKRKNLNEALSFKQTKEL